MVPQGHRSSTGSFRGIKDSQVSHLGLLQRNSSMSFLNTVTTGLKSFLEWCVSPYGLERQGKRQVGLRILLKKWLLR